MKKISWGIIGCGDVAEVKSGPAFQQTPNSELVAVMRRNGAKAKDFATRHGVPYWYANAQELLDNDAINAIYIATPPDTHVEYALKALAAGKHVYLEKPIAKSATDALQIVDALRQSGQKLTVAHYRRALPAFRKVKNLLDAGVVGEPRLVDTQILQPAKSDIIAASETNWRIDPSVSGGGYFHDLAPHQIDLLLHYFGKNFQATGFASNQAKLYTAHDTVNGLIRWADGLQFRGTWCFNVAPELQRDNCTIYGSEGAISFSFYGEEVITQIGGEETVYKFTNPPHIQSPMIAATVEYFLNGGENPCPIDDALAGLRVMDSFTGHDANL